MIEGSFLKMKESEDKWNLGMRKGERMMERIKNLGKIHIPPPLEFSKLFDS